MVYFYFLILMMVYVLFEVIVKKQEKILLIALIPGVTILLIKHTKVSSLINDNIKWILTIISILSTIIIMFIYFYKLIKNQNIE